MNPAETKPTITWEQARTTNVTWDQLSCALHGHSTAVRPTTTTAADLVVVTCPTGYDAATITADDIVHDANITIVAF